MGWMDTLSGVFGTRNEFQAHAPVNTFQAKGATLDNSNYAPTIDAAQTQAQGGAGPASGTITRQNALNDMLTAAANGQGPSAAQNLLQQQTQRNINTAAGQVASARGVNPALAARMAVNSAGQMNQEAAATGATLRANEQLAAREQLGRNLAQTGATQLGQQATGANVLGTAGGLQNQQNAGRIQNTLGTEGINAGVASQNAALDLGAQQINAGIASQNAATNAGLLGGLINGAGAVASMGALGGAPVAGGVAGGGGALSGAQLVASEPWMAAGTSFLAEGGEVPQAPQIMPNDRAGAYLSRLYGYADGGQVQGKPDFSGVGKAFTQGAAAGQAAYDRFTSRPVLGAMYSNGGSIYMDPAGKVPGRAEVPGDSPVNDKVHTMLSPGEIVLPRSVVNAKNPGKAAASFVASVLRRQGGGRRLAGGGRVAVVDDPSKAGGVQVPPASKQTYEMSPRQVSKVVGDISAADKKKQASGVQDLSDGGMVQPFTARGRGRSETRSRIKRAQKEA